MFYDLNNHLLKNLLRCLGEVYVKKNLKYTFEGCIKLYFQLNITCMHA